jgi:hypothetical protein
MLRELWSCSSIAASTSTASTPPATPALHAAIARGDAVVKVLASRHARLIKNKQGATPLDLASGGGGRGGRGGAGRGAGGGRGGPGAPPRESTLAILRQYYPEAKTN